jgi:hypothetical protein
VDRKRRQLESTTGRNMNDDQKRGFNRGYAIRGTRKHSHPASACPICFNPSTSKDTTSLIEHRCTRGHEWIATRQQGEAHAIWLARYITGVQENR